MNYTDDQLKAALAKMLPETVCYEQESLYWQYEEIRYDRPVMNRGNRILDTELLHLCWLVEETLSYEDKLKCANFIYKQDGFFRPCDSDGDTEYDELFKYIHASWQNRIIALAKVKGIEI